MVNFQRSLSTQDNVMQNIIQYIVNPETNPAGAPRDTPILPGDQAQKLISSYAEARKESVDIMNDLSVLGASLAPNGILPPAGAQQNVTSQPVQHRQDSGQYTSRQSPPYSVKSSPVKHEYRTPSREGYTSAATSPDSHSGGSQSRPPAPQVIEQPAQADFNGFNNFQFPLEQPSGDSRNTGGLRVFTTGYFAPRQEEADPETETPGFQSAPTTMPSVKDTEYKQPHALRVRRQTFVPGWTIPPKILLVDDDAVYRNMSSKFLQVFGCEADVAVDGFSALDKVNMQNYDLILMDVVMPNLDGIAATSMIRQFDSATPIISMTSNVHTNDINQYFESGMLFVGRC
jgi:osomolarity two-component system, response regulator SKN7